MSQDTVRPRGPERSRVRGAAARSGGGRRILSALSLLGMLAAVASPWGCSRLASRKAPRLQPAPQGVPLEPAPPAEVVWLRLVGAHVPSLATGGRPWDEDSGLPDPYAVVRRGDTVLLSTDPVADSHQPVWGDGPRGNFELGAGSKLSVELWDDDGMRDQLIASITIEPPAASDAPDGVLTVDLDRGALVRLAVEPAHPLFGLGFSYTFTGSQCLVSERFAHGPAARAGIGVGDAILIIDDQQVAQMSSADLRSVLLSVPMAGLSLVVQSDGGAPRSLELREGPVYPLMSEQGPID